MKKRIKKLAKYIYRKFVPNQDGRPVSKSQFHNLHSSTLDEIKADAEYILSVGLNELDWFESKNVDIRDMSVLEVGTGKTLGSALLIKAFGAARITALDPFMPVWDMNYNPAVYGLMRDWCIAGLRKKMPEGGEEIFNEVLGNNAHRANGLECSTSHLEQCEDLADQSFDLVYSNAVLEHIAYPEEAVKSLFRVGKPGSFSFHQIDFRCHGDFDHPLDFLLGDPAARRKTLESLEFAWGNGYRLSDYLRLFKNTGFEVVDVQVNDWVKEAYFEEFLEKLKNSSAEFRHYPEDELKPLGALIVLRKP